MHNRIWLLALWKCQANVCRRSTIRSDNERTRVTTSWPGRMGNWQRKPFSLGKVFYLDIGLIQTPVGPQCESLSVSLCVALVSAECQDITVPVITCQHLHSSPSLFAYWCWQLLSIRLKTELGPIYSKYLTLLHLDSIKLLIDCWQCTKQISMVSRHVPSLLQPGCHSWMWWSNLTLTRGLSPSYPTCRIKLYLQQEDSPLTDSPEGPLITLSKVHGYFIGISALGVSM